MKLMFLMEHLYPVVGGAERSAATLIEALRKKPDIEIDYICTSNYTEQALERLKDCDIIITQLTWADEALKAAKMLGKKSILFVRSFDNICDSHFKSEIISHCGQKCRSCPQKKTMPFEADLVYANSIYCQTFLKSEHDISSRVLYPFVDLKATEAPGKERKFITMNQFAYHKGADIFLRIATELPQYQFRVVGYDCWKPTVPIPGNVSFTGTIKSSEIWRDTSIFLAPARWNETFGRTLLESQYNKVPVIASNRGAAKDDELVTSNLLIEDIENIELWKSAIAQVFERYPYYVDKTQQLDFDKYSLERNIETFYRDISDLQNQTTDSEYQPVLTSHSPI